MAGPKANLGLADALRAMSREDGEHSPDRDPERDPGAENLPRLVGQKQAEEERQLHIAHAEPAAGDECQNQEEGEVDAGAGRAPPKRTEIPVDDGSADKSRTAPTTVPG